MREYKNMTTREFLDKFFKNILGLRAGVNDVMFLSVKSLPSDFGVSLEETKKRLNDHFGVDMSSFEEEQNIYALIGGILYARGDEE